MLEPRWNVKITVAEFFVLAIERVFAEFFHAFSCLVLVANISALTVKMFHVFLI